MANNNFFRQYLLGESLKNILIRLTVILLATIIIWCFILIILIFYIRNQRRKHLQYLLESKLNLTNNSYRYHSSSTTNENSLRSKDYKENKLSLNTHKIQTIIQTMTKPPLISNHKTIIAKKRSHSLSDNELKSLHLTSNDRISNPIQHLPLVMITDTNSSYTNIVELETFEDQHHVKTKIEKHLIRQLSVPYHLRYST